jgi:apolipoprotein N-acyltransferase
MHARMAIVRAVENGCSLIRPCANGLSLVADPLGRIIASRTTRGADGDTLAVRVPLLRLSTVYPRAGYLFPVLIILCLPFVLVPCLRSRRRSDRAST